MHEFVHPSTFRSSLLSGTAMTTTQHKKGGGLMTVVAIATAVVMPYVAPMLSTAIGLSGAIGSFAGSALVGAGLGALGGYATGGSPLLGAIGGAVGGGAGGYSEAGGFTGTGAATGVEGAAGAAGAGGVEGAVDGAAGLTATDGAAGVADASEVLTSWQPGGENADLGQALTGGERLPGANYEDYGLTGLPEGNAPYAGSPVPLPSPGMEYVGQTGAADPSKAAMFGSPTPKPEYPSWGNRLMASATNPDNLAQAGLRLGSQGLAIAMTGTGEMSDAERRNVELRNEAMERQTTESAAQNKFKTKAAESLQRQADYYDPNYTGAQDYASTLNRRARQRADAVAGVNPGDKRQQAGLKRRYDLDTARAGGSAFSTGYDRGLGEQTRLTTQAASLFPSADRGVVAGLDSNQRTADGYYRRLQAERKMATDNIYDLGEGVLAGAM